MAAVLVLSEAALSDKAHWRQDRRGPRRRDGQQHAVAHLRKPRELPLARGREARRPVLELDGHGLEAQHDRCARLGPPGDGGLPLPLEAAVAPFAAVASLAAGAAAAPAAPQFTVTYSQGGGGARDRGAGRARLDHGLDLRDQVRVRRVGRRRADALRFILERASVSQQVLASSDAARAASAAVDGPLWPDLHSPARSLQWHR